MRCDPLGIALVIVAAAGPARAQAKDDPVAAEALFRRGRELLEKGDYAGGCPKFEASFELHPSASTVINIAKCHEHDGKVATAWGDYSRAIALNRDTVGVARQRALDELAHKGQAAMEARMPKLRIVVESPPAGLRVTRDQTELPAASLSEALPADPGSHTVVATAPGFRDETRSVTLEEAKTTTVSITLTSAAPPSASTAPARAAPPPPPPDVKTRGGVPAWAWITGGFGVALAGGGAFFLAQDLSAIHALRNNCATDATGTHCAPGYNPDADNARKNRSLPLAIGLGGAGVVAIGVAIVGIATAPPRTKVPAKASTIVSPWLAPGAAGAAWHGSF